MPMRLPPWQTRTNQTSTIVPPASLFSRVEAGGQTAPVVQLVEFPLRTRAVASSRLAGGSAQQRVANAAGLAGWCNE